MKPTYVHLRLERKSRERLDLIQILTARKFDSLFAQATEGDS